MFQSIKKIFHYTPSLISWGVFTLMSVFIWYYYSDIDYVAANYENYGFAYYDTALSWSMILIFPILLSSIVYKSMHFGKNSLKKKSGFIGIIGGIVSTFITGCVCCGVSLLSVLGLTSIITFLEFLPFHGIELKSLAILLLVYSTYDSLRHLEVCAVKK